MQNKEFFLIILGVFSTFSLNAISFVQNDIPIQIEISDIPPGMTEIDLYGTLDVNPGPNTVEAYADANNVYIYFYQNFGNVNIILLNDSNNIIYDNTINTAVQNKCVIPISNASMGLFTLVLNNANGYAEGGFTR